MEGRSNRTKAIQFMMSKGCVRSDELLEFIQTLRGDRQSQFTDDKLLEAVANMNAKLKRYNMMVRYTLDDKTHERFFSLISTVDNEITRKASHHTDKEFDYFKRILEELQDGAKQLQDILDMAPSSSHKSVDLIDEWVAKRWLVKDDDLLRLGPRTRAELDVVIGTGSNDSQARALLRPT